MIVKFPNGERTRLRALHRLIARQDVQSQGRIASTAAALTELIECDDRPPEIELSFMLALAMLQVKRTKEDSARGT